MISIVKDVRASKNTLYEYLDYNEDVFLAFRIPM